MWIYLIESWMATDGIEQCRCKYRLSDHRPFRPILKSVGIKLRTRKHLKVPERIKLETKSCRISYRKSMVDYDRT